jgi:hypothetical protein
LRRWWGNVESGVFCHHALETDTDTFDDGEENGATDGTVAHGLITTTDGKSTTGEEAGNDGVPGVFLLAVLYSVWWCCLNKGGSCRVPNALDCTVKGTEHAAPNTKVTTENWSTRLDGGQSTYPSLSIAVG